MFLVDSENRSYPVLAESFYKLAAHILHNEVVIEDLDISICELFQVVYVVSFIACRAAVLDNGSAALNIKVKVCFVLWCDEILGYAESN